jgi:hypothetical protein
LTEEAEQGQRFIRAAYTGETITVYQAYSPEIAGPAVRAGTFVPPFSRSRMTWIKPSFGWMMYRCGWGGKPGQERVLAISITRTGFEWALAHSSLSSYNPDVYPSRADWEEAKRHSPVRVQWDPDRSLSGAQLSYRAIQVGLSGEAAHRYVDEWIRSITDITDYVHQARSGPGAAAGLLSSPPGLPLERVYPLDMELAARIGATVSF